jgi:hypothetical protein
VCGCGKVEFAFGSVLAAPPQASNTEAMNARRAEFARSVAAFVGKTIPRMGSFPSSPHAVPVPGGAGRHGPAAPVVPDTLSLPTPPPCTPDLNPVENLWPYLPANWPAISLPDSCDALPDACCTAWNRFANDPETVTSLTGRSSPQGS